MKSFFCGCGKAILVDDEDYDKVKTMDWNCWNGSVVKPADSKDIGLAHVLISVPSGLEPDHKDRNIHNNQKSNLRIATESQNKANRRKFRNNKSGYIGVFRHSRGRFRAQITVERKIMYLGIFPTAEEAAQERDKQALKHFGEFAVLNFPDKPQDSIVLFNK